MNLKCIVCYKPCGVLFEGISYCKEHFENIWKYRTGMKKVGDEKNWGKSLVEMKNEKA